MEVHEALFAVGVLIVTAKLLEGVFKRLGVNAIFAYAIAGVVLGPVTGLVHTGREIDLILSIGIFMFFFLIGLEELDIAGFLAAIRGRIFFTAVLAVTLSMLVSLAVTTDYVFDLGLGPQFHGGARPRRRALPSPAWASSRRRSSTRAGCASPSACRYSPPPSSSS